MSLITELKRRNVLRIAAGYLVVGWLLTEVLTAILPILGAPDWVSKAIILIFAFGFIPAVIFSWVYELTPQGLVRQEEIDRDDSSSHSTGKTLEYVTIAAVVVGVIFFAVMGSRPGSDAPLPTVSTASFASIAVLPFVNLSGSKENEYFSDGLTETLLHMLAQIPGLKVAARTSSFAFKNQNKTIVEIAKALDVAHILEGSVQRSGDRVRITAQLIRAEDGFHVWSENYDRTLDDIFGIQDEIAEKVGGALSASLLGVAGGGKIEGVNTSSADAFDLYLLALNERATISYGGLSAAEGLLKGALTIDPDFLDAKTELANNYLQQVETGLMEAGDAYTEIMAITDQVLLVKPDDVVARAIKLFTETQITMREGDPAAGLDAFDQLQELIDEDPTALQPRIFLNRMLRNDEQIEQALTGMLETLQLDPFNPRIHFELGNIYTALERWDEARVALKKSLELEPAQPNAYVNLARLSLQKGDALDYLQLLLGAMAVDPVDHELPGMIASYLYRLELVEEGDDFRNRVMAIAPTSEVAYRIELLRAMATGDEEASIASARRAIEDDIEDRQFFAFGGAAQYLLRVAAARGTVAEESAYLEAQAPGILDLEATSVPYKYRVVQIIAFDAWYTTLSKDALYRRIDYVWELFASFGADLSDDPQIEFAMLAFRGEVEQAIEVALEHLFSETVAINLGWEETIKQAQYAEIIEDPRIQAAMQRWQNEEDELRERIRTYLADLYASS